MVINCYSIIEVETVSPIGLRKSEVTRLSELQWYINVTWTPTMSQFGQLFIFCYRATDSTGYVYNFYVLRIFMIEKYILIYMLYINS